MKKIKIPNIQSPFKLTPKEIQKSIIFGLTASSEMAATVAKESGIELGDITIKKFADSEIFIQLESSVRAKHVFVIQSTQSPANDNLMELLIFLDAAKRASAKEVTVIMPYYGYARQDRKVKGRQAISAKLTADLITKAGADRVMSFEIHSDQIQGFFDIPFDNLKAQGPIKNYIDKNIKLKKGEELVIVSPDHGGVSRARAFAKRFDAPLAVIDKRRTGMNQVEANFLLGDVKGKTAIIVDDIVDTANTMAEAIRFLKKEKASRILVVATHGVLSGTKEDPKAALKKLIDAGVEMLITTNTISTVPHHSKVAIVDLSKVVGDVIRANLLNKSVSEYFEKKWN